MKKFLTLILCLIIFLFQTPVFALSELYYLNNTDKTKLETLFYEILQTKSYTKIKTNPIIANKIKDNTEWVSAIFQKSGNDVFYYFESSDEKKSSVNNLFLKKVKKLNIDVEQMENKTQKDSFSKIVTKAMANTGSENKYKFQEELPIFSQTQTDTIKQEKDETKLQGYVAKIKGGTKFNVYLQKSINTASALVGDEITAVFNDNWAYNGNIAIQKGSFLKGQVIDCHPAKAPARNGMVKFKFTMLYTPDGKEIELDTEPVAFNVTDEGRVQRYLGSSLTGALVGGLLGLAIGAIGGDASSALAGLAIGAGTGAISGVATNVAAKGVDAEIPALTELEVVLDKTISLIINN